MIGSHPSNGLPLKLVMLHAVKPKDLLRMALVCQNWWHELRKDEYWYKFRNAVLAKLPTLEPLFFLPPKAGAGAERKPLWYIFAKRIWPVAANLQKSAADICSVDHCILSAIIIAFKPKSEHVVNFYKIHPNVRPHLFGGVKVFFASGCNLTVLFKTAIADDKLIKLLGLKKKKIVKPGCFYTHLRHSDSFGVMTYERSVKEFFLPFLKIVFPLP
jgi:hypothetical protein